MLVCTDCKLQFTGGNTDNLSPIQKIYANKHFDSKEPKKSESMPNCYTRLSQEPIRYAPESLETQNPIQLLEDQNESVITMNSNDNTPLTSRKESKNDLRKYVKMVIKSSNFLLLIISKRSNTNKLFTDCRNATSKGR